MELLEKITSDFIINNFREGLLIIDSEGTILSANKRIEEILNYTSSEISGKNIDVLFRNKHIEFYEMLNFLEVDELTFEEIVLVTKSRKQFYARLRIKHHRDTGMQMVFVTNIDQKVKARVNVEKKVNAIEKLTRSAHIRRGHFDKAIAEILQQGSKTLGVTRVNAWLADKDFGSIHCIGSYIADINSFVSEKDLQRTDFPEYFNLLQTEEAIVCHDTFRDYKVKELLEPYIKPYGITSMMDIPIRMEGKMAGVICYEHTGPKRTWDIHEQKFGLFSAQLISLALETKKKQNSNIELQTLLKEVNHRTKNNLNIAISLLKLQAENANDDFHKQLFEACCNRLYSLASLHHHLYQTSSFTNVELGGYLKKIADYVGESFNIHGTINQKFSAEPVTVNITTAVSIGLITNELLTNAFKHAFTNTESGIIELRLYSAGKKAYLCVSDNGKGIGEISQDNETLGTTLVKSLVAQTESKISWQNNNGTMVKVEFSL